MKAENSEFATAMAGLNPAQKQAVETLYGPVLVVAGPGTGKTQVIALRIANILQTLDTAPHNILALTFTENGALNMRRRLLKLIGPTAHSVRIGTFHSFCQDMMSEYPEKFLMARKMEVLDEVSRMQMLQKILADGNFHELRPYRSPTLFLKDIQKAISDLKREDISPARFAEVTALRKKEYETIPESEKINSKTGKMKMKYLDEEKQIAKISGNFSRGRTIRFRRYDRVCAEKTARR
jgi:DNA helicase-2/ATP-dependent DNA helicase PcrA